MINKDEIIKYLTFLHKDHTCNIAICSTKNHFTENLVVPELEKITELIAQDGENYDYWCSVNSFSTPHRLAENASEISVLICEFDIGEEGHNNKNQPFKTKEECLSTILNNYEQLNLPPGMVVDSGHGVHCYWKLSTNIAKSITPEKYKEINEVIFQAGLPFELQNKYHNETKDLARIMRIPGLMNKKNPNNPVPAKIIDINDSIFDFEQVQEILNQYFNKNITITNVSPEPVTNYFDLPIDFINWCKSGSLINPKNGKTYDSSSEREMYIISYLNKKYFSPAEILEFFEENMPQETHTLTKYKTKDKQLDSIKKTVNKLNNTIDFIHLKATGEIQIFTTNLLNWHFNNFSSIFKPYFCKINKGLKLWNGKYWKEATDNNKAAFYFKYFKEHFNICLPAQHLKELIGQTNNLLLDLQSTNKDIFDNEISITFLNGTLYIKPDCNWEFKEEFKSQNLCLYMLNVKFNKELFGSWQDSPIGEYLINYYSTDTLDVMQRFMGQILIPELEVQKVLCIKDDIGGSGKGVLMNTLQSLFYNSEEVTSTLNVEKWESNHENVKFATSIFNICSEISSRELTSNVFKTITGGDMIQINPKFQQPYDVKPLTKHILSVNRFPNLMPDSAILRRLIFIQPLKNAEDGVFKFKRDMEKNNIYLLMFMLEGLMKQVQDHFKALKTVDKELVADFIAANDTLDAFVEECLYLVDDKNKFVTTAELFKIFNAWKVKTGTITKITSQQSCTGAVMRLLTAKKAPVEKKPTRIKGCTNTINAIFGIGITKEYQNYIAETYSQEKDWDEVK